MENRLVLIVLSVYLLPILLMGQDVSYLSTITEFSRLRTIYLLNGNEIDKSVYESIIGNSSYNEPIENKKNVNSILMIGGLAITGGAIVDDVINNSSIKPVNQALVGIGLTSYVIGSLGMINVTNLVGDRRDQHNRQFFSNSDNYVSVRRNIFKPNFTVNGVSIADKKLRSLVLTEYHDQYLQDFFKDRKIFRTVLYTTLIGSTALTVASFSEKYRGSNAIAYSFIGLSSIGIYYSMKLNNKMENSRTKFMDRTNLSQLKY